MVWWQSVGSQTCKLSQTTGRNLWCFELQGGFDKEKYDVFQGKRGFTKTEELTQQNLVNSAGGFHQIFDWNGIRFLGVSGRDLLNWCSNGFTPETWILGTRFARLRGHIANTECHDDKRFEICGFNRLWLRDPNRGSKNGGWSTDHCTLWRATGRHVNFQSVGISHFCIYRHLCLMVWWLFLYRQCV